MSRNNILLLLAFAFLFTSCGSKKEESVEGESVGVEMTDDAAGDELITEGDFVEEDSVAQDNFFEEQAPAQTATANAAPIETAIAPVSQTAPVFQTSGNMKSYTVGKNETLMLISFKLYGDFRKWKEIAKHNQSVLIGGQSVKEGMVIQYEQPMEEFVWTPEGEPYLIKWGDTLGIISNNVYGSMKRWKEIWNNNRVLIKDPNKIYAGFTIYYLPDGNDVALN